MIDKFGSERAPESLVGCGPSNDGKNWLVKLETLFTRLCPLSCRWCHMVHRPGETDHVPVELELNEEGWMRAAAAYRELQLPFTAIYGSEILEVSVFPKVLPFIKELEKPGEGHVDTTVITSCIGLNHRKLDQLYDAGLRSFTTSVDSLSDLAIDKHTGLKSEKGWHWAKEFVSNYYPIRDCEVIFTVCPKNIEELPSIIRASTDSNIWVHFDIAHFSRGQPGSKVYPHSKVQPGEIFLKEHMPLVEKVMREVLDLKDQGYLIHPARESIEKWFDWKYVSLNGWTCAKKKDNTWPGFATVEPNGLVRPCDDFLPPEMVSTDPIYVWDLTTRLNEYVERVKYFVEKYSCSCWWETHHSAGIINRQGSVSLEHYKHTKVLD